MANVTLTASANYDDLVCAALTNGDDIITGTPGVIGQRIQFTMDSDCRWGRRGVVLGRFTGSAAYENDWLIDGTKVWWLPFDGASGQHDIALTSAQYYDAPAYTNQTTEANNATANDMTLLPTTPAVNDAYYFGYDYRFVKLWLNIGTNGAGTWTITWEYYNGSSWSTLPGIKDGSTNFRAGTGWKAVQWDLPTDWATTAINGVTTYWIRARVSAYTSITTRPLGTQARISVLGFTLSGAGGAIGEIIDIWSAYGVAPVDPSSSSATGWFKLKSKTGTFVDDEALSINGSAYNSAVVNSASGGKRGWLHIVTEDNQVSSLYAVGAAQWIGDWFELDSTTTGVRGQTIQLPVADAIGGVWIETSAGSGTYEFWPSAGSAWDAAQISTDLRSRLVEITTGGLLRIGQTAAAANVGDLPPSGCKIRIANVILSASSSANWNANVINATIGSRARFGTGVNPGLIQMDKITFAAGWTVQLRYCNALDFDYVSIVHYLSVQDCLGTFTVDNCNVGMYGGEHTAGYAGAFTGNLYGGYIRNCKFVRYGLTGATNTFTYALGCYYSKSVNFENILAMLINYNTAGTANYSIATGDCEGCTWTNIEYGRGQFYITEGKDLTIDGLTYFGAVVGDTDSSVTHYVVMPGPRNNNVVVKNLKWKVVPGYYVGAPTGPTMIGQLMNGVRYRDFGTKALPLDGNALSYFAVQDYSGNSQDVKMQRIYISNTRTGQYLVAGQVTNVAKFYAENVWGDASALIPGPSSNLIMRGCFGGGNSLDGTGIFAPGAGQIGTHFFDAFHSTTRGKIGIHMSPKSSMEPSASSYVSEGSPFWAYGPTGLSLRSTSDKITWTWSYYILGYTGFENVDPWLAGTNISGGTYGFGNHRIRYCLDKNDGNGFGEWKEMTGANLSAETGISAALGFKPKVEISCVVSDGSNAINKFVFFGTTDSTSQAVLYPYVEEMEVTLKGIVPGSSYVIKDSLGNLLAEKYHSAVADEVLYFEILTDSPNEEFNLQIEVRKGSSTPNYLPFETGGAVSHATPLTVFVSQILDAANP